MSENSCTFARLLSGPWEVFKLPRLRLRLGGDLSRQDYGGSKFDQTFVSAHTGPRWLVDKDTDVSLVANARRRWTGTAPSYDDLGVRVEAGRRLTPRIRVSGRRALNAPEEWGPSDHCRIEVELAETG